MRVCLLVMSALVLRPMSAEGPQQQRYVISLGTPADTLASGTLWLYSYSWYGLQQHKLASIEDGRAAVSLDVERLKRQADPHPNTEAYIVAIQAGQHLWFRTPDIAPDKFWADLRGAIGLLGSAKELLSGETQLVLATPAKRRVTFLHEDGRPKPSLEVDVSIYLWNHNHCGFHQGLPLGKFRTDALGTIELLAPALSLYFDGLEFYARTGTGPAGSAYSRNLGMKIGGEEAVTVRVAWKVPHFPVELRVVTPAGRPRAGVDVYGNWNTNTCGGADRIARTNSRGAVRLDLDATFTALSLMIGGPYSAGDPAGSRKTRDLSDGELRELFSRRRLTIRW